MLILLLRLALGAVYCFAVLRWTRRLPVWLRRLTRSFLLCLLYPALVVQEEYSELIPRTFYFTLYWGDLNLDEIKKFFCRLWVYGDSYMVFGWLLLALAVHIWMIQSGCAGRDWQPPFVRGHRGFSARDLSFTGFGLMDRIGQTLSSLPFPASFALFSAWPP
jgi:hypothetical protein